MEKCLICKKYFEPENMYGRSKIYCKTCFEEKRNFILSRKYKLELLKSLSLELKIKKSQNLISEAIDKYGISHIYISYSGGKDSTVLSHIARQLYPDILHIFSNTTCEYPETIKHVLWERDSNGMNLEIATPYDRFGKIWNFKRVVEEEGFPAFSKVVANAIRTYRRAQTDITKQNSLDYMNRRFKKFIRYKDFNISDKCCEKLKKAPIKKLAKTLGMDCSIIGTLAEESRQRELDWINYGCNVFEVKKDNQCRPLSFWTEEDIYNYIEIYNLKISDLYSLGYTRNGCMFCGFGVEYDVIDGKNRYQRLAETHPKCYKYLIENFKDILDECNIKY